MVLFALALLAAQPAESPSAFIAHVYAGYAHQHFSPLKQPERFFAPALTAAIEEDARLAKDEVGYLDGDPLCDCQDFKKITAHVRSLRRPTPRSADARVRVDLGFGEPRELRMRLELTRAGWRIADVVGADGHSLLEGLRRSNAEQRR